MSTVSLDQFLTQLRAQLPGVVVYVKPTQLDDDPNIKHFIHLLGVPAERLGSTGRAAWDLAYQFWEDPPFLMTEVTPEHATKYYPNEFLAAQSTAGEAGAEYDSKRFAEFFAALQSAIWKREVFTRLAIPQDDALALYVAESPPPYSWGISTSSAIYQGSYRHSVDDLASHDKTWSVAEDSGLDALTPTTRYEVSNHGSLAA